MPNVIVTVDYGRNLRADVGLPLDVPCRIVAAALAKALDLDRDFGEGYSLMETDPAGSRRLPANATLAEAGIMHGRLLTLLCEKQKESGAIPQGGAFLVTADGQNLSLNGAYTLIGRRDLPHNILPDIDLTERDTNKIASRRHASVEFDRTHYTITDLNSANGTWVNGVRLEANASQHLNENDELMFGKNGVCLIFQRGG